MNAPAFAPLHSARFIEVDQLRRRIDEQRRITTEGDQSSDCRAVTLACCQRRVGDGLGFQQVGVEQHELATCQVVHDHGTAG